MVGSHLWRADYSPESEGPLQISNCQSGGSSPKMMVDVDGASIINILRTWTIPQYINMISILGKSLLNLRQNYKATHCSQGTQARTSQKTWHASYWDLCQPNLPTTKSWECIDLQRGHSFFCVFVSILHCKQEALAPWILLRDPVLCWEIIQWSWMTSLTWKPVVTWKYVLILHLSESSI